MIQLRTKKNTILVFGGEKLKDCSSILTSYLLELRMSEDSSTKKIVKIEATASNLQSVEKLEDIDFIDGNPEYIREHEFAVVGSIGSYKDNKKCLCVFDEKKSTWRVMKD
jgi:hypothetical protein